MRRWFVVKTAADVALVATAIFGAFVAERGITGEARLSYQQGMLYTALRLVLSPRILHYLAPAYDDLSLLTCRFWAIDIPALYCFLRAIILYVLHKSAASSVTAIAPVSLRVAEDPFGQDTNSA